MAQTEAEVIVVGGGFAGLSAAVYLGRARRDTLVIDSGRSMGYWEPDIQNYLGFPGGISGRELLQKARQQVRRYGVRHARDEIVDGRQRRGKFRLRGRSGSYCCSRLLLATGIYHIPPEIPGVRPCLGHSMFFCKDCDGYRVRGRAVAVYGSANEAVEYALGMLLYSSRVAVVTDGREPRWDRRHAAWMREYRIPVRVQTISGVRRSGPKLQALKFCDGSILEATALFTTRGDVYFNKLAKALGAAIDRTGEIIVRPDMRTTVRGLYAAGCVTPANCQMIIAAGQGATAAQAINRDLFEASLATHSLRRLRWRQLRTKPERFS